LTEVWSDDALAERGLLIAEGNRLRAEARVLHDAGRVQERFPLDDRVNEIARRYRELLPDVTVARCPHSGALVRWPIDTAGLDGWFWEYNAGARRAPASRPPLWLAMPGAVRLTEPVEHTPYRVMPGPGVPFVVPRILRADGVRAVVAQVPVGIHTGWAISYFGPKPKDVRLVNLWGQDTYPVHQDDGTWTGWDRDEERVHGYDFDLAHWLRSGKLLWIEPGDESGTLHEGVDGCPYLDLPGERRIALVEQGKVWYFR
jgi:hypothetical protein